MRTQYTRHYVRQQLKTSVHLCASTHLTMTDSTLSDDYVLYTIPKSQSSHHVLTQFAKRRYGSSPDHIRNTNINSTWIVTICNKPGLVTILQVVLSIINMFGSYCVRLHSLRLQISAQDSVSHSNTLLAFCVGKNCVYMLHACQRQIQNLIKGRHKNQMEIV